MLSPIRASDDSAGPNWEHPDFRCSNLILSVVHAFGANYNRASRDTRMILPAKFRGIFLPVFFVPIAVFAHHAYSAEFDTTKPVKLSGVLTRVEWSNPHIWIYLDVKDEKGNITNWGFSASPPGMLQRRGITKSALKLGEVLTIAGHRAKDGSNNASGNVVTFADGQDALIGQDQALNPAETRSNAGKKQ